MHKISTLFLSHPWVGTMARLAATSRIAAPKRNQAWFSISHERNHFRERGEVIASLSHFPDFYTKQALKVWRSPLHADFYWNVKGKSRKKRKNTASFVASLGAGVQPRSTVQLFMPVSGVEKPPFSQFFLCFGVSFGQESLSWPAMSVLTRNKSLSSENESNMFDDFWVRAYRFDFAPRRRPRARSIKTVDFLAFNFRQFGRTAERYAPSSAQVTSAGLSWAQLNATQPKRPLTKRRATQIYPN